MKGKKGLAFFEEKVVKLKSSKKYKVPNVGFSRIQIIEINSFIKI